MISFEVAYALTMRDEGTYADNPVDRGGETWCGISRARWPRWGGWVVIDSMKTHDDFPENLVNSPALQADVYRFYREHFWEQIAGGELLEQDIANEVFDTAVNQGVGTAITYLQRALNVLNRNGGWYADLLVDGNIGPRTLHALGRCLSKRPVWAVVGWMNVCQGARYMEIMEEHPEQEEFALGWLERVVNRR